jgi:serine/threonine protein kinase/TPR repeat protein
LLASRKDEDVEHQVAIKILNSAFTSVDNIERFKKERQIIARLDHENIGRFIDAGSTDSGMLFVVMEYIQGSTIKEYCQQNQLDLEQKLKLFLQLCSAVDYAHKHFIIHRDIKPANILVTDGGKLKLLDFGIAKLFDDSQQQIEATATKIMTPAYASPEQLLGKPISIQSDLYAMGVVLFEMIIGVRPFQDIEKDTHSFHLKAVNGLTMKPSELLTSQSHFNSRNNTEVNGDIDALLTKAINPDAKHRYEVASELTNDINNYLTGYPIKARKPSKWYFYQLFIKRNKLTVALSALSIGAILGFVVFSFIQNKELKKKSIEVTQQRDEAILQAKKAKLASDFLLDSFQTADPIRSFGEKLTIKKVMEDSYNKLNDKSLLDHELSAQLYNTMSKAFYGMNVFTMAHDAAQKGLDIYNGNDSLLEVSLLVNRAKGNFTKSEYQKSLVDLNKAISICKSNNFLKLCEIDDIYLFMAKISDKYGNKINARKYANKALSWLEKKNIKGKRYLKIMVFLIRLENNMMQPEKAIALYQNVNSHFVNVLIDEIYYYYQLQLQYIYSLIRIKNFSEAEGVLEIIIDDIEKKFGTKNTLYIRSISFKSSIYAGKKNYKDAIALLEDIIKIKQGLEIIYTTEINKIGKIYYYKIKNYEKALNYFKKAVELDEKNRKKATENSGYFYKNIGMAYYHNRLNGKALKYLYLSKEIFENIHADHEDILKFVNEMIAYLEGLKLE